MAKPTGSRRVTRFKKGDVTYAKIDQGVDLARLSRVSLGVASAKAMGSVSSKFHQVMEDIWVENTEGSGLWKPLTKDTVRFKGNSEWKQSPESIMDWSGQALGVVRSGQFDNITFSQFAGGFRSGLAKGGSSDAGMGFALEFSWPGIERPSEDGTTYNLAEIMEFHELGFSVNGKYVEPRPWLTEAIERVRGEIDSDLIETLSRELF